MNMNNLFYLSSLMLALTSFTVLNTTTSDKNTSSIHNTVVGGSKAGFIKEEDAENIPWAARRILSWEDFQSAPQLGTEAVASTSTSLGLSYQLRSGVLTYEITCNFSKPKSWGSLKTDYILAHEQGHFDITEIHARKLYKALADLQFNRHTYKEDINAIYQQIVKEKEEMQETYDQESDHSRNHKVQSEWFTKIDNMLTDTEAYATYP